MVFAFIASATDNSPSITSADAIGAEPFNVGQATIALDAEFNSSETTRKLILPKDRIGPNNHHDRAGAVLVPPASGSLR